MNKLKPIVLALPILCAVLAAASSPVAVRVEVTPVGSAGDGTRVELTVQVSPEDRARIGRNAMVRVELDGAPPPGQSPLWAVRIAADGSGTIDTVWPPGEYALRVEISNPSGTDSGLWVGTVRIAGERAEEVAPVGEPVPPDPEPGLSAAETQPAAELAETLAESAEPAAAAAPADPAPVEEVPTPEPASEEPPGPQPGEIVRAEETPVEAEEEPVSSAAPAAAEESAQAAEEEAAVPAVAGATAGAAVVEPIRERPGPPAPEADAAPGPGVPTPEPGHRAAPDDAVVEPLRSSSAAPTVDAEPAPGPEGRREEPSPAAAEMAAMLDSWNDAAPGTVDLTVVAFRGREPAVGLEPADFRLEVGGVDTVVSAVGDATRAPLQLGVAVHVVNEGAEGWSRSGGRLHPLVGRAGSGSGHVFFAAGGRVGDWDRGSEEIAGAATGELTSLITEALANFDGRRGRKFLIVVTDGRTDVDKAAWRATEAAAGEAGVPVLVVALWDEDFSHKVRKNLKAVAEASGGGLFLVQGSDQLDRASERFGPMLDAGVALRFEVPASVTLPAKVAVNSVGNGLEISAPKGVR